MTRIDRRMMLALALAGLPAVRVFGQQPRPDLGGRPPARPVVGVDRLVAASGLDGSVSYALIDPDSRAPVQARGADDLFPPASTMKALTALYALARLGPAHRFRTRILRAGDLLILAGGGDPVLDTDDLARLADDLVAAGQTSPARFAVWAGALPQIDEIAPAQADHLAYNPALSGMILNFNRVHLGWQSGGAGMQLEARAAAHSPRAYTITAVPADQQALFGYRADARLERWTVSRAAVARAGSRWLPVRKPALYAGDVFQTLCRARGLVLPTPEIIDSLPVAEEIAAHDSQPLTEILRDMLYYSTNLTAEVVGLTASGAATVQGSAASMQGWLAGQGLGQGFRLVDHSGLSTDSRVSAGGLARALAGAEGAGDLTALLKHAPLDDDLGAADGPDHEILAKTGTLNFVSNLAGWLRLPDGRQASFAILCQNAPRHGATSGQELPAGVLTWTRRAKRLQRDLLTSWAAAGF